MRTVPFLNIASEIRFPTNCRNVEQKPYNRLKLHISKLKLTDRSLFLSKQHMNRFVTKRLNRSPGYSQTFPKILHWSYQLLSLHVSCNLLHDCGQWKWDTYPDRPYEG